MKKKVLIISYYFPPSGGAGVQRWAKFVKYLPDLGYTPIVLTVDEKYASYPQKDTSLLADLSASLRIEKTKTKEILSLYKKVSPNNEVPYGGFANEKKVGVFQYISRFIRGNFFLPDPRRGWNKYAFKRACELIDKEQIDIVLTTSPPHSTQLIGLKLKKKYPSIHWVADLRDPWTDIYYQKDLYQTTFAKRINANYEEEVLQKADRLITVSESCKKLFQKKLNQTPEISVVQNGYDEDDFSNLPDIKPDDRFIISYVGVLSPQYVLSSLLSALSLLPEKLQKNTLLRFVGTVSSSVKTELSRANIAVEYIPMQVHKKAIAYMCASDALLLLIPSIPNNEGILTGKIFEYLAAKRPVVLIGPEEGDAARLIDKAEAGKCFDYNDHIGLADYLNEIMLHPVEHTNENYKSFSRKALTKKIVSSF